MTNEIHTFDLNDIEKIAVSVRRLETQQRNLYARFLDATRTRFGRSPMRFAKTTTNTANPTYPDAPANTFVCKRVDLSYTAAVGDQALTTTVHSGRQGFIARSVEGIYLLEDTLVELQKGGRGLQWIVKHYQTMNFLGQLNGSLATGDPTCTVDELVSLDGMTSLNSLTAQNKFAFFGNDNKPCLVCWDGKNGEWILYQVDGCS